MVYLDPWLVVDSIKGVVASNCFYDRHLPKKENLYKVLARGGPPLTLGSVSMVQVPLAIIKNVYKLITSSNTPGTQVPSTPLLAPAAAILTTSSPPRNSPSKLGRYLDYASEKLGVRDANAYEEALACEGYGPDILPYVEDKVLLECGLTPGDAICLKRGAAEWWNSSDAKWAEFRSKLTRHDQHRLLLQVNMEFSSRSIWMEVQSPFLEVGFKGALRLKKNNQVNFFCMASGGGTN